MIGLQNDFANIRLQAIIRSNASLELIGYLATNCEIQTKIK